MNTLAKDKARVINRGTGSPNAPHNVYQVITEDAPTDKLLEVLQTKLGFDSRGYGRPMDIITKRLNDTQFVTVWKSYASAE